MRIAYIGRWTADPADGIRAKAEAHAARWRAAGHEVVLFGLPTLYERSPRRSPVAAVAAGTVATARLRRAVRGFSPDVMYIRYGLFVPSLAPLQRRFASVLEFNARDREEAAARGGGRARHLLNEVSRRSMFGRAGGIVCVTSELARDAAAFGKPTRVIANGAELDVEPAPAPGDSRPHAVFLVGVTMPKHGVDKLLALAREIPECDFTVVGADPGALPPVPQNVRLLPPLSREDYAPILARADVGVGPLAMHRAGMHEGSPLKVREYLAHGLPVIIAYEDTDFAGSDPWFLLRLPNTEDNVRAGDVREFLARVRGRRVARAEIADRVGAAAKEAARLAFMSEVASARR